LDRFDFASPRNTHTCVTSKTRPHTIGTKQKGLVVDAVRVPRTMLPRAKRDNNSPHPQFARVGMDSR
jgi:hypothetical protein